MKRRILSLILALTFVFSLAAFASAAAAPQYIQTFATGVVGDPQPDMGVQHQHGTSHLRASASNALGAPDAPHTGGDAYFTGMRYFSSVTYSFDDVDTSPVTPRLICNNPSTVEPDLSLIEVTWNDSWHVEAVDVYLQNATVVDPNDPLKTITVADLFIGRAYNKFGVDRGLGNQNGYEFCTYVRGTDNFAYTNIFFPDNIISASAVRLVDMTTAENTPTRTANSYVVVSDDGYDLDAIKAWYVKNDPAYLYADVSCVKFIDLDIDGIWDDGFEPAGADFLFQLTQLTAPYAVITTTSAADGSFSFTDLEAGDYMITEIPDPKFTQTTLTNGVYFTVTADKEVIWQDPAYNVEDAIPEFGNAPKYEYKTPETAWGGVVTSDLFPTVTGGKKGTVSKLASATTPEGGVIYRTGKSAWSMAVEFNGTPIRYPLISGQYTQVGEVIIAMGEGSNLTVTYNLFPGNRLDEIHCGAYADLGSIPSSNGHLTNGTISGNVVTIPYNGGTVYIAAHSVVAEAYIAQ